jgi:hypothetical protein
MTKKTLENPLYREDFCPKFEECNFPLNHFCYDGNHIECKIYLNYMEAKIWGKK